MIDKNIKINNTTEYKIWINELKQRFRQAQIKAAVKVNTLLLEFYWELGADIVARQKNATWGSGFLKQLSQDLMVEFPDVKGFSAVNLQHVRRWYLFYSKDIINSITGCYEIEKKLNIKKTNQNMSQLCLIPWGIILS